jgi:diguanylate cyclase (GGDEF)-like protein
MDGYQSEAGVTRLQRFDAGLVVLFTLAFIAWLVFKPAPHAIITAVDDVGAAVGPFLGTLFCVRGPALAWWRRRTGTSAAAASAVRLPWTSLMLGLGLLSYTIGQSIFAYNEQILHHMDPFPSWADAGYLGVYPFLLLGILLVPQRPLTLQARVRAGLDGMMIMAAAITFSWFFLLGPTLAQSGATPFAKIVAVAYPLGDLVLIASLLTFAAHPSSLSVQPALRLLALGLVLIVASDSILAYQNLQGTYATGELLDVGWPAGFLLIGLGTTMLWQTPTARAGQRGDTASPTLGQTLLPYAFLPAVCGLLLYTWFAHGDQMLETGVFIGSGVLIALIVARQLLALLENRRLHAETLGYAAQLQDLNAQLQVAHAGLEANNEELQAANSRLEALATTDALTGMPNHRALVAALDYELERAQRYGRSCSVLFIDLDHFKALNDGCGHAGGDAALRELAQVFRAALRSVDVLGRWGGEEFIALLPELEGDAALAVAERVRMAVSARMFQVGGGVHLTCSIGVASYPQDAAERDSLVERADRAMYAAKRLGRNQVRAADDAAVRAMLEAEGMGSREAAALAGTVEALAALVEARDHYTGQHTQRVAALTMRLALMLKLDATQAHLVGLAARLHDVGKVAIPDAILQKPGRLTPDEWARMRTHPTVGADVLDMVPALRPVAPLVRAHHERWDGLGYPAGLAREEIPLGARIVAVADAFGAITSDRPYQQRREATWALKELRRCAGTQFDPVIVEALARMLSEELAPRLHAQVGYEPEPSLA